MSDPPLPKKQRILDEEAYQALLERIEAADRASEEAKREREEAKREREEADREREEAKREREEAKREREEAKREREEARLRAETAEREREEACARADTAECEREEARARADTAECARDEFLNVVQDKFHLTPRSTWTEWRSQGPGGSSVSAAYAELEVQFVKRHLADFVLPLEVLCTQPRVYFPRLWPNGTHKVDSYSTESDIKCFMDSLFSSTVDLLNIHPLTRPLFCHSETRMQGLFGEVTEGRVDISLGHSTLVVGLCEVKKPWRTNEEHQTALKQLFAYLCSIELVHRRNVLGLLSTANTIQICWLDGDAAESLASAQSLDTVPAQSTNSSGKSLCYTEPVQCTDPLFMQAFCSFVLKCAWSSSMTSMDRESEWCCVYGEMDLKFPRTETLSEARLNKWNSWSALFQSSEVRVVQNFSPGGDGFAQLIVPACNVPESDPVFQRLPRAVVKFFYTMTARLGDNEDHSRRERITLVCGKTVDREVEKFNQVNSHLPRDFQAFRRTVRGVPALIMPFCTPMTEEDFRSKYAQNLADFIEDLRKRQIAYTDLKLGHITTFEGELTLIDTCRVTLNATEDQLLAMERDYQKFLDTL